MSESADLSRQPYRFNADAVFVVSFVWPHRPGANERHALHYTKRKSWQELLQTRVDKSSLDALFYSDVVRKL